METQTWLAIINFNFQISKFLKRIGKMLSFETQCNVQNCCENGRLSLCKILTF